MAAEKRYAKLGFFIVVSLIVMLATGLFFIQRLKSREVINLVTYFNENVSGLDISSPVRFRGVSVGRVSEVRIHPKGDLIEVDFELFKDRLITIGESAHRVQQLAEIPITPNLRARVVGNPVSGEGYLLLDIPKDPPPPLALGFTPRQGYVPSMPSPLASVQERLPAILERVEQTLETLRAIVARVPDSIDRGERFFTNVERILRESQLPELSANLRTFSTSTSAQMAQVLSNLDRLVGSDGSLTRFTEEARSAIREANISGSAQAARDAADRTSLAADELRRSLPAIRETLTLLREVTRQLDEQPESIVYGPRPPQAKTR